MLQNAQGHGAGNTAVCIFRQAGGSAATVAHDTEVIDTAVIIYHPGRFCKTVGVPYIFTKIKQFFLAGCTIGA